MKRILISLASFFMLAPSTLAATILSIEGATLDMNHIQNIPEFTVTAEADGEITAEHGINILLDPDPGVWILWHDSEVELEGSAVDNGRVAADAEITWLNGYKVMHVPVLEDFLTDEELTFTLMRVRTYDDNFNRRYLEVDLDGDFLGEATDVNGYKVDDTEDSDNTTPYPVTDVSHSFNEEGNLVLTWTAPPDYDIRDMRVDKWLITDGNEQYKPKVYFDWKTTFIDDDLGSADQVRYKVTAEDNTGKISPAVELTIDLVEAEPEPTEEPEEEPQEEEEESSEAPESEVEELSRLMNYYNVRYSIKCKPSGVQVADNDSACLWARIDLIYSQELTGDSVVEDLNLSEYDLGLMESRRKWPELRYQDNCVEADEPASYCSALGKAIERTSYFLD